VRRVLTKSMVVNSFRCIPQLGLIYLFNPKVACSTIQYSISAAAYAQTGVKTKIQPHRRTKGPFIENIFDHPLYGSPELRAMTCFTVVRNPFLRILSGYLHKIVNKGIVNLWGRFASEHGLDPDSENRISFIDFLRIVDTDCDETLDVHFKPQYLNLMMPFSRPHFIGRLEKLDEVKDFLAARGVSNMGRKGAVTNTSGRLHEFYTTEAEEIVARKFADDFRLFGYSPRVSEVGALLEPQWQTATSDLLMGWLVDNNFPADQLDPACLAYVQFRAENDRGKKIEIVRRSFAQDDSRKRLAAYFRMATQYGESALAAAVEERLQTLKNAWRGRVQEQTAFVPAKVTTATRSERRAMRREKLESGRKGLLEVEA
jgi:hypothetical protein